ncbi:MAG: MBL fold metallo-hydrolase [Candidatus Pacebacteria bacterium]|nr:MBL fold metallo-hydrolase [Candidatus Paceibacterota bacterium]
MIITHHGAEFFKVSFGDTVITFNPISKESNLKQTRFGADIALISLEHPDMNGVEQVTHGEKKPFVVSGPGEYEINEVLVKGYSTVSKYGGIELINTVYLVRMEKMLLLFLGALNTKDLPADLKEALDEIDILFVPIGGDGVLEPDTAHELAVSIEPRIVIPMHYSGVGIKNALDLFLKEEGTEGESRTPIDKLTIKSRDLDGKQNEVVVLSA